MVKIKKTFMSKLYSLGRTFNIIPQKINSPYPFSFSCHSKFRQAHLSHLGLLGW